jgi:hypothetical protein
MTQPVVPQPAPAAKDNTTLFGVLGIVLTFCFWIPGVIFSILSLNSAKKAGKSPTLAYVGFALQAVLLVLNIIYYATR